MTWWILQAGLRHDPAGTHCLQLSYDTGLEDGSRSCWIVTSLECSTKDQYSNGERAGDSLNKGRTRCSISVMLSTLATEHPKGRLFRYWRSITDVRMSIFGAEVHRSKLCR